MQVGAWQDQSCKMFQTLWGSVTPRWEVTPLPHLLALQLQTFRGPTAKPRGFSASWFWAAWWPLWSSRMSSRSSRTGARQWHPCPKALDPQEGTRKQPDPCELLTPMKTYQQANKSHFSPAFWCSSISSGPFCGSPSTLPDLSAALHLGCGAGQLLGTSGTRSRVPPRHRASVLVLVPSCFPNEHPKRGAGRGAPHHPSSTWEQQRIPALL